MPSVVQRELLAKAAQLRKTLGEIDRITGGVSDRDRDAERKRAQRGAAKNVIIPRCQDRKRREELEEDDEEWLLYYFSIDSELEDPFWYRFTFQQREMIKAIGSVIKYGGDKAVAASRGEGKTTIFERTVLKYTLQGLLSFSVLFAATGTMAENSLDSIKIAIQENPLLAADYPEVCRPVAALNYTPSRAHYQTVSGFRFDNDEPFEMAASHFTWCGQEIILPSVPGSPSSKAIIATRGLDTAIRGLKRKGRRPELAGIDDPDTDITIRNEEQAGFLEKRIERSIAGLGGQQRAIGRVMLTTIQNRKCVSYKFTDPAEKPSWKGQRFRYLITPPTNKKLWDEYVQMYQEELREFAAGKTTDEHCRRSHQFYLDHRDEMNAGAEVANENRFNPEVLPDGSQVEVSSLQHYYNQVARTSAEDVATELDSNPPEDENQTKLVLSAHHIQNNCLSGLAKREVPEGTVLITTGADVQKLGLHYVTIAWNADAAGCIIDYDFHEFLTEGRKAADCEVAILEGLFAWYDMQLESPFLRTVGDKQEEYYADLTLIDSGWKEETWNDQPVKVFCRQVGFNAFIPSKGVSPYHRPKDSRKVFIGDNWHVAYPGRIPLAEMNSDHWKLKVHEGFLSDRGQPGALTLFDPQRIDGRASRVAHLSYAKHILAESWESRFVPGFKGNRTGWWKSPKPNHYFDATYQAICARSMRGVQVLDRSAEQPKAAAQAPAGRVQQPAPVQDVATVYDRPRW